MCTRLRLVSGAPAAQVLRELLYLVAVLVYDNVSYRHPATIADAGAPVLILVIVIAAIVIVGALLAWAFLGP